MVDFLWRGDVVAAAVKSSVFEALRTAGEHVLEEANRTVPLEEGVLLGSGTVTLDESVPEAIVSYDTPYAVIQHERLDFRHAAGRRAKWLELTLQERSSAIQRLIADGLRGAFR